MGDNYTFEATDYPGDETEDATGSLLVVLEEIADERRRQDVQWGGPGHDDRHHPQDWEDLIKRHATFLTSPVGTARPDYRQRLIKVAAIAAAAALAWDRAHAYGESGEHVTPPAAPLGAGAAP
ncbi:MAG: hypothetical protein HQL40_05975 [Alphaproteobacteria bacterium]|nr:hypothetical protein [Alphaproteobacteria bacterium]